MKFRGAGLALLLVIVNACAALLVPILCDAKVSLAGAMVSGAVEVPFKFTTSGVLMAVPSPHGTAAVPLMDPTNVGLNAIFKVQVLFFAEQSQCSSRNRSRLRNRQSRLSGPMRQNRCLCFLP